MAEITVTRTTHPKPKPADETLTFGKVLTDHMFMMEYDAGRGWHDPRVVPYGPFTLDPATCVLHYGQAIFDGMKAFRGADGRVRLFRLADHARRLNRSAQYLCIPELDSAIVEESIRAVVEVDQDWVPKLAGTSLYIRPTVIATETFLGVHPSGSYIYYVILCPVGAYYKEGMNPVRILASDTRVRAVKGGLGAAKTAANYAASLYGAEEAQKAGYTQVLWLDGAEHAGHRAKLVDALARLAHDPASLIRDKLQACRLRACSMTAANLRMLDRSLPRRRKPRRRRMGRNRQGEGGPPCGPTGRAATTAPTGLDRPTDGDPLAVLSG